MSTTSATFAHVPDVRIPSNVPHAQDVPDVRETRGPTRRVGRSRRLAHPKTARPLQAPDTPKTFKVPQTCAQWI